MCLVLQTMQRWWWRMEKGGAVSSETSFDVCLRHDGVAEMTDETMRVLASPTTIQHICKGLANQQFSHFPMLDSDAEIRYNGSLLSVTSSFPHVLVLSPAVQSLGSFAGLVLPRLLNCRSDRSRPWSRLFLGSRLVRNRIFGFRESCIVASPGRGNGG